MRPVRDCQHVRTRHEHGTYVAYVQDKCGCGPCRAANAAYTMDLKKRNAYGRQNLVDAKAAKEHIEFLRSQGMGCARIARKAGLSPSGVGKILYGHRARGQEPCQRIRRSTEAAILAVKLDLAPRAAVDGTGTRRRMRALVACGWSQARLGRMLGIRESTNVARLVHRDDFVRASSADVVRDLYDRLWNQPPPESTHREKIAASRSRRYAAARGWPPPLAWDDDGIDDPTAVPAIVRGRDDQPDLVLVERAVAGERVVLRPVDRVEAIRLLKSRGATTTEVCRKLRMGGSYGRAQIERIAAPEGVSA